MGVVNLLVVVLIFLLMFVINLLYLIIWLSCDDVGYKEILMEGSSNILNIRYIVVNYFYIVEMK